MTETLRLPSRPASRKRRSRRRGTIVFLVVVGLVAGAAVGAWAWWNGSVGPLTVREICSATAGGSTVTLDPEQAGNAAIIASVAQERDLPARAATIAIATAIQESKLSNIDYGDRDSLGLFQQRPSQGWGTRKQVLDPVYASNAFYDKLIEIKGYETKSITKVAQRVQRSAFPEAYAEHEPQARIAASALSGYSPGGFTCTLRPTQTTAQTAGSGRLTARARAVRTAAAKETGHKQVSGAGHGGTAQTFIVDGGTRASWGLASWAVARAEGLSIVSVAVGDQRWDRKSSADGWQPAKKPLPGGQVIVTVA
jgi:hypothetical protein